MTDVVPMQKLRALRGKVDEERKQTLRAVLDLAERADSDQRTAGELEFGLQRIETLDRRLQALPEITDIREPDMYRPGGPHSFFGDLAASTGGVRTAESTIAIQERLGRHHEYESRRLEATYLSARAALDFMGIETRSASGQTRALGATTAGAGGEYVPPAWIVEQWASGVRAASPLARLVTRLGLPDDTLQLEIPRFDTSAGVVPTRQTENTNLQDIEEVGTPSPTTDAIVSKVATLAGDVLLSQQLYDRGGIFNDQLMLGEFNEAYAAGLQYQLINGTGQNGQLLGLLNVSTSAVSSTVPGAQLVTYTSASPTQSGVIQAIAQTAALVADTRNRAPEFCLMRGSRYFWLAGTTGGSGDPGQRVGQGYLYPAKAPEDGPFGPVGGLPVYLDSTIPNTINTNEDTVIVVRGKDILLLEDPAGPRFSAMPATTGAGEMTVVIQWHCYTAAFTNRYPSSIGTTTGTGFVVPSGF